MKPRGSMKPGGVAFYCDGIITTEVHTSKCKHCGEHTDIPSLREMMDHVDICRVCMEFICLGCVGKPCIPEMKRIEAAERAFYQNQQRSKLLGY